MVSGRSLPSRLLDNLREAGLADQLLLRVTYGMGLSPVTACLSEQAWLNNKRWRAMSGQQGSDAVTLG